MWYVRVNNQILGVYESRKEAEREMEKAFNMVDGCGCVYLVD